MTESEIVGFIATQKTGIEKFLKGAKDELSNLLDDGVHNYLENQRIKYSRMKTFLFRNETVEFEKIYFPLNLQSLEIEEDEEEKIVKDPFKLIKDEKNITIIGEAGSGKSMLMVNIFTQCIKTRYKIPIIVELRNLKYYQLDILKYVQDYILDNQIKPNSTILDRALKSGRFIFLFDGYDEIDSESIGSLTNGLISFVDKYSNNEFVLTSRPGTGVENLKRFRNWFVNPLETKQIENFIDLQVSLMRDPKLGEKMKMEISKTENAQFLHFLRNPLLLSMFIFTFRFNPELPKTKSKFYWNVFDTLSTKHDSITKGGGYLHSRKCGLSLEEIETVLMWFSYISFFEENFSFEEAYFKDIIEKIKKQLGLKFKFDDLLYDLKINISILVQDGLELKFPHRSLQEYFAALLICKQSDSDKEKIYGVKFINFFNKQNEFHHFGSSQLNNFLTLCFEMDRNLIILNLFLPVLKGMQESFIKTEVRSFLEYCQLSYTFYNKKDKTGLHSLRSNKLGGAESVLLDFLGLGERFRNLQFLNGFVDRHNFNDEIEKYIVTSKPSKPTFIVGYKENFDYNFENFLESIGFKKQLNQFLIDLDKKIVVLEKNISTHNKFTTNLLGI